MTDASRFAGADATASVIGEVAAERRRQVDEEGWTPEHDDVHIDCSLASAAATYALPYAGAITRADRNLPIMWPWDASSWKPHGRRRDLVRAAALIVAEIERLDRAARAKAPGDG